MGIDLMWHMTCPHGQAEKIVDLINGFHPAKILNRNQSGNGESIVLAFEETRHIGNDLHKIFNTRNFESLITAVKAAIREKFGDGIGFYPITRGYRLPTIQP